MKFEITSTVEESSQIGFGKPRRKKSLKRKLKDKADKLFSLQVRRMGVCELQGKDNVRCGGVLQCAHIETRGAHAIRWNMNNALCICAGHHVYYTNHPSLWDEIVAFFFPQKWKWVEEHRRDIWDKDIEKILNQLS